MHNNSRICYLSEEKREERQDFIIQKKKKSLIYGWVVDEDGKAIENVTVKLVNQDLNPLTHTLTTKTGYFILVHCYSHNTQLVLAKQDYQTRHLSSSINPGKLVLLKQAWCGCDVIGRVCCEDHSNPHYATIILDKTIKSQLVTPDYTGWFILQQLQAGKHEIEIVKEDCQLYQACFFVSKKKTTLTLRPLVLKKKNMGCTLHGLVKDNLGNPLVNATVFLYCATCHGLLQKTMTNSQGLYFFGNISVGQVYIKAVK